MARILVVDDSPTVRFMVRRHLAQDGHEVDHIMALTELVDYLAKSSPDLILLDLEMPALSYVTFARFLRRHGAGAVPIVIHSSRAPELLQEAAQTIGAAGYISKKARPEELRQTVAEILAASPKSAANPPADGDSHGDRPSAPLGVGGPLGAGPPRSTRAR